MKQCQICGSGFNVFSGGPEPFTTHELEICNECGSIFKQITSCLKNKDLSGCQEACSNLLMQATDQQILNILQEYAKGILTQFPDYHQTIEKGTDHTSTEQFLESIHFKTTTGYNFDGYTITNISVISGDTILGTGLVTESALDVINLTGSSSKSVAQKMKVAKKRAYNELIQIARDLGANALIGVDFDYVTLSSNTIGVSANGTAVTIEKINNTNNKYIENS